MHKMKEYLLIIGFLHTTIASLPYEVHTVEACERETLEIRCPAPDHVILVTEALFGRMRTGRCLTVGYGRLGCKSNVLSEMDGECSGRPHCSVEVSSLYAYSGGDCPAELMSYVQASYMCVPVMPCGEGSCQPSSQLRLPTPRGTLLLAADAGQCGAPSCPWVLRVQPGQRLNLTLYHLTATREPPRSHSSTECVHIGTIQRAFTAGARPTSIVTSLFNVTLCDDTPRVTHVTLSDVEDILVFRGLTAVPRQHRLLLSYQVTGCPALTLPSGSDTQRRGDVMTIRCSHGDRAWHLICDGQAWVGEYGRCPLHESNSITDHETENNVDGATNSKAALLLVVCSGLVIGILFGVSLLALVAWCYKRQRKNGHGFIPCGETHLQGHISTLQHSLNTNRCEKHGVALSSYMEPSMYAHTPHCTHLRQQRSPHPILRPDLCMQGFRPVPEGDVGSPPGGSGGETLHECIMDRSGHTPCRYDEEGGRLMNSVLYGGEPASSVVYGDGTTADTSVVTCSTFKPSISQTMSCV